MVKACLREFDSLSASHSCAFRQDRVEKAGPLGRPAIDCVNPDLEVSSEG